MGRSIVRLFWAVTGIICATVCPLFIMSYDDKRSVGATMVSAFVCTSMIYFAARRFRHTTFVVSVFLCTKVVNLVEWSDTTYIYSAPHGWWSELIGNFATSIITIVVVTMFHGNTRDSIIVQALLVVAVFGLMEVGSTPAATIDYGVLQYLLRLPIQTAAVCYARHFVGWYLITAFVFVFGTLWQSFYLKVFVHRYDYF